MDEMGLAKGSFDHGDPTTTNLYVGNLAPTVTEEALEVLGLEAIMPMREITYAKRVCVL